MPDIHSEGEREREKESWKDVTSLKGRHGSTPTKKYSRCSASSPCIGLFLEEYESSCNIYCHLAPVTTDTRQLYRASTVLTTCRLYVMRRVSFARKRLLRQRSCELLLYYTFPRERRLKFVLDLFKTHRRASRQRLSNTAFNGNTSFNRNF